MKQKLICPLQDTHFHTLMHSLRQVRVTSTYWHGGSGWKVARMCSVLGFVSKHNSYLLNPVLSLQLKSRSRVKYSEMNYPAVSVGFLQALLLWYKWTAWHLMFLESRKHLEWQVKMGSSSDEGSDGGLPLGATEDGENRLMVWWSSNNKIIDCVGSSAILLKLLKNEW